MKKLLFLPAFALAFISCDNQSPRGNVAPSDPATTDNVSTTEPRVGGQTNSHGCDSTAGFTWSELRQDCVQVFEQGTRLNPVEQTGSAESSAFVITSDDNNSVEIFVPETDNSYMLQKTPQGHFENANWRYDPNTNSLFNHGTVMYQAQ